MKSPYNQQMLCQHFLSDLCGREVFLLSYIDGFNFLSDLCGREEFGAAVRYLGIFLSDLCGREEVKMASELK